VAECVGLDGLMSDETYMFIQRGDSEELLPGRKE